LFALLINYGSIVYSLFYQKAKVQEEKPTEEKLDLTEEAVKKMKTAEQSSILRKYHIHCTRGNEQETLISYLQELSLVDKLVRLSFFFSSLL
jgi:hypothetical protein